MNDDLLCSVHVSSNGELFENGYMNLFLKDAVSNFHQHKNKTKN